MCLLGSAKLKGSMRSARIVQMQGLIDSPAGLRHRPELVIQKVFLLEDPIYTLRHSILSAMVFFGHTDRQARLLQSSPNPEITLSNPTGISAASSMTRCR
jgi:hypothetical protein